MIFSSDYPHGDKPVDEIDEKFTRIPTAMPPYRPSKSYFSFDIYFLLYNNFNTDIPDHMTDDINQISHPSGVPIITPPFSHLSHQNQHSINTIKKDDDHVFLHPSCMGDHHRRIQDTYSNNGNNSQQTASVCIIDDQ